MAASELHEHFHRECEYHCTPCPRCSRTVLIRDMREHRRASCHPVTAPGATHGVGNIAGTVERDDGNTKNKKTHWAESLLSWVSSKPKPPPQSSGETGIIEGLSTAETGMLEAVRRVLQEAGDIKTLLLRALRDNEALNDSLAQVCQSVNSLKESVKQELAPVGQISEMTHCVFDGMSTLHGALSDEMADIKKQTAEELTRIRDAFESAKKDAEASAKTMLEVQKKVLAYAEKNESRSDFFIPGIELLEALALNDGNSAFHHEAVYLRGYKISPGVELRRKGRSVSLEMGLQLHRGDHDDEIQWPFEHKIRFTILHPVKNEEQVFIDKTWPHVLEAFEKPTSSSNTFVHFNDCFDLGVLKTRGYVYNHKLRVVMELL
ncbi:hypothetical protein HPB52_002826 [Rhipicephalus sanguineus]|uniref:TRAF1-6 MATH domain-containing protein n=1 Tax=Rhipicephalus sanguineus TaxID=34632 RepID=A0A9D4PEI5_RHISA|nr:hypothetical protein HPB52_002826 [Rhipicephalus sanguineus]